MAGYLLRNWFDRTLTVAERLLGIVLLGFFGWWFVTGYGYDLWHAWRTPASISVATAAIAPAPTPTPFPTTEALAFVVGLAPGAMLYPQLGNALPISDDRRPRPVAAADYLIPARPFIPPLPPTPVPPTAVPTALAAPTATPAIDRQPARLSIPAIGLDARIAEVFLVDGVWQVADYAVGYHHGTGMAGVGNTVLAGHKGIRGAVFSNLEQLQAGQELWIDSADHRFRYRVEATWNVWPNQVEIMYPTDQPTLTLMTCTNWDTQRFVVRAVLVDIAPLPSGT